MKKQTVIIQDVEITAIEYKGQRMLTFAMIDKMHQRSKGTASRNFRENRKRFIEGKHFIHIPKSASDEIRRIGIKAAPNGLFLLTEKGYLLLAKSLHDERAWEVQDNLIDKYFRAKAVLEHQSSGQHPELTDNTRKKLPGRDSHTLQTWRDGLLVDSTVVNAGVIQKLVETDYRDWILLERALLDKTLDAAKSKAWEAAVQITQIIEPLQLAIISSDFDTALARRTEILVNKMAEARQNRSA